MSEVSGTPEHLDSTQQLRDFFEFAEANNRSSFGSLFSAMMLEEDTHPAEPQVDTLADLDEPDSSYRQARFNRDLGAMPHQEIMDAAGLQMAQDAFSGSMRLVDGQKFVQTLGAVNEADDRIRSGVESVFGSIFARVLRQYTPSIFEPSYDSFHLHPGLLPDSEFTGQDSQSVTEVLLHASQLTSELRYHDVSENVIEALTMLQVATAEGLPGEWAVAHHWGLFNRPSQSVLDSHWTQWTEPEHWQKFYDYLHHMSERAPQGSKFVSQLAASTTNKLADLLQGNLEPSRHSSFLDEASPEDIEDMRLCGVFDDDEDEAEALAYRQEYEAMLIDVQRKIQAYL